MKYLSQKLANKLVEKQFINKEYISFYKYGFDILQYDLSILLMICLISIITNNCGIGLLYIVLYRMLRSNAGGYHCETFSGCFFISVSMFVLLLVIEQFGRILVAPLYYFTFFTASIIICEAPVEHVNHKLDPNEIIKYKKRTIVLTGTYFIGNSLTMYFNLWECSLVISWVLLMVACLILLVRMERRK